VASPIHSGGLVQLALSPLRLFRLSSPWYGRGHVLADRLDALYRGRTFGDLLARPRGPDLVVAATDLTTGAPFEFTPEQFALICSDLSRVPLSFAVAASSAVPLVLTPMTLRNWTPERVTAERSHTGGGRRQLPDAPDAGQCGELPRCREAPVHPPRRRRPERQPRHQEIAGSPGRQWILVGPLSRRSAGVDPQGRLHRRELGARPGRTIDRGDRVPTTRQVVDTLLFGAGGQITQVTLAIMSDDKTRWHRELGEQRGAAGSPFAADAELHVITVSLHDVEDPALRHSILTVPTAFSIDAKEVRNLVEAGRDALRHSPEFRRLRHALAADITEGSCDRVKRNGASAVD
jgi:NTE family protein